MLPRLSCPTGLCLTPVMTACVIAALAPAALAQQATSLDPVVISGKGFEQRAFDTPYSVNVIDADTLRSGGLMVNLSETMARVPGLTVNSRNNYAQDLQISSRGYGARSTFGVRGLRLYSDGIPATGPDGQGQVSHFDLAGAQRVEVLRGPFSALYGNSSGGVISVFSAPVRERSAEVGLDVARFGTHQARVTIESPLSSEPGKGWDIRVGASYFETDGFRPQSEARRTLGNVRLGYSGERDKLVIALNHLDQPALDALGLTRAQMLANPRQTTDVALPQDAPGQQNRFNTRKDTSQDQVGLNWRHRFETGALSESALTTYYGQRSVTQWQSIPVATQQPASSPGGVIDFDRDYAGVDGRLIWRWALDGDRSAQFVAGAAYEESKEDRRGFNNYVGTPPAPALLGVTGALRRDEANKVETTDAYAQGEVEFVKNLTGTVGVRTGQIKFRSDDRYLSNGDDSGGLKYNYTNPVAALQWRAASDLNLYVSAGRGFESPTFGELAYRPDGLAGVNTGLAAQTSRQVEVGAKWRPAGTGLAIDLAVFEASTSNEIGVARNSGGRSSYQNVGHTTRRGIELGAGWQINRDWRAALALTTLSARYEDSFRACTGTPCTATLNSAPVPVGNRIAGTTPRSAYAELAWHPLGSESTELAAEWRAQGRTPVNDLNTDYAQGWSTFALRASQRWKLSESSSIDVLLRLDNAFDRVYAGSVIVNEGNSRYFEPGAPRNWLLSVKWKQAF